MCLPFFSSSVRIKLHFFPYRQPRGFAFVQFLDPRDASEAQYYMNRQIFNGMEISVVEAAETRKRPEEMRHRTSRFRGPEKNGGRRSSRYGRSRSRSISRSRSRSLPYQSRSYSPSPRRKTDYSVSPRRPAEHSRSRRNPPTERDGDQKCRSLSPANGNGADQNPHNGCAEKATYMSETDRGQRNSSRRRASRSPLGSRSRSPPDLSPRHGR
ncbi:putative RNA recognition motif domain-containing protein [Lupinus albus]|uniref:Putative RNA recognition motif domain-containing protein n=1 Tax=Lupinus albus TaxID=3870 RepID=A0A6A4QQ38_LUPAL|nr:putative RNA recognition motif domain-containing protein [Lupinus albus]